jgi:anthranilate phosphoribosyltransferase
MTPAERAWPAVLAAAMSQESAAPADVTWAMNEILEDRATPAQIAAFLTALRVRGESPEHVRAIVESMLGHATLVDRSIRPDAVVDIVGTGGDGSNSVNISTMAALVVAAAGAPVIKHGNRAASSATGSADALEALGIRLELGGDQVAACVSDVGIGFCFAPAFHPALRFAGPTRRELGVPTVFNIVGPLANPAQPEAILVGCARIQSAPVMAQVLLDRGTSALVVRGEDGLDEISTTAPTRIWDATGDQVVVSTVEPGDFGIAHDDPTLLVGGSPERNVELLRATLDPHCATDDATKIAAIRDAVVVNAAAALTAYDAAIETDGSEASMVERIAQRIPRARAALESGDAWRLMETWAHFSERFD